MKNYSWPAFKRKGTDPFDKDRNIHFSEVVKLFPGDVSAVFVMKRSGSRKKKP